jgi:hypothetical protein
MVAVMFRGTDYRTAIGHAKVPSVECFCERIEANLRKWNIPIADGAKYKWKSV